MLIVADAIRLWDLDKGHGKRWQYDSNYLLLPLLTRSRSRNHSNSLYLLSLNCKANTKKFILAAACLFTLGTNISAQNPEKKEPVKKECPKNDAKSCDKKDAKTCDKKDGKACDQKADKSAQEASKKDCCKKDAKSKDSAKKDCCKKDAKDKQQDCCKKQKK